MDVGGKQGTVGTGAAMAAFLLTKAQLAQMEKLGHLSREEINQMIDHAVAQLGPLANSNRQDARDLLIALKR